MKKLLSVLLCVFMITSLAACGDKNKEPAKDTDKEPEKLVTNGRLSALEPPEGWKLKESSSDNQLFYLNTKVENRYGEPAQLWIDIDEYSTPEERVETAKELNDNMELEYEVKDVTIGDVSFKHVVVASGYSTLFGVKDDVTLCISHDKEIDINDKVVQSIINSIKVAPEK